jgi:hypothetical protein
MKAKFLKRNESVKSDKLVVWFEVEGIEKASHLKRGDICEVELCDTKLPNMAPSPKDLLKQALTLISQASEGIPELELPLSCDTAEENEKKCGNCATWSRINDGNFKPIGSCANPESSHVREPTPIYHWCSYWTSRTEEEK